MLPERPPKVNVGCWIRELVNVRTDLADMNLMQLTDTRGLFPQ